MGLNTHSLDLESGSSQYAYVADNATDTKLDTVATVTEE